MSNDRRLPVIVDQVPGTAFYDDRQAARAVSQKENKGKGRASLATACSLRAAGTRATSQAFASPATLAEYAPIIPPDLTVVPRPRHAE